METTGRFGIIKGRPGAKGVDMGPGPDPHYPQPRLTTARTPQTSETATPLPSHSTRTRSGTHLGGRRYLFGSLKFLLGPTPAADITPMTKLSEGPRRRVLRHSDPSGPLPRFIGH